MKTIIKNVKYVDKSIDILINNDKIESIGENLLVCAEKIIDGKGLYAHDGIVNAYFNGDIEDAKKLSSQGVVAVFDFSNSDDVTKVLVDNGLKVYKAVGDFNGETALTEEYLDNEIERVKKLGVDDVILFTPSPNISDESQYTILVMYAKKYNYLIATSVSENLNDVGQIDKEYSMSPIELLESYGFLDFKNFLIDCVYVDKEDVNILKNYDTTICTCPTKNLQSGSGIAPLYSFVKNEINVVVGGNTSNMINEYELAKNLQSGYLNDVDILSKDDTISMMNCNVKNNFSSIGSIKVGDYADIILTNEKDILKCTPLNIKYNIVNGKIIYNQRIT